MGLYDPVIGRIISADSLVPSIGRPLAFNRYAYVEGDPVSMRDPSGQNPFAAIAFFVGAHITDSKALQMASSAYLGMSLGSALNGAGMTFCPANAYYMGGIRVLVPKLRQRLVSGLLLFCQRVIYRHRLEMPY